MKDDDIDIDGQAGVHSDPLLYLGADVDVLATDHIAGDLVHNGQRLGRRRKE